MLKSDNLAIRILKSLVGLTGVAVIVMLWPTIVFSFPEKGDSPNATAHVKSCVDTGPITRRGFGRNWDCVATIRDDKTGETWTTSLDMNFFTPDEIGTPQRLTWTYGGSRISTDTSTRTYTQAEGFSSGTIAIISFIAFGVVGIPALLLFVTSITWLLPQEDQRKYWEKIHGTPEERAAKKAKDDAFWAEIRQNRQQRKEERRRRKEASRR